MGNVTLKIEKKPEVPKPEGCVAESRLSYFYISCRHLLVAAEAKLAAGAIGDLFKRWSGAGEGQKGSKLAKR